MVIINTIKSEPYQVINKKTGDVYPINGDNLNIVDNILLFFDKNCLEHHILDNSQNTELFDEFEIFYDFGITNDEHIELLNMSMHEVDIINYNYISDISDIEKFIETFKL